MGRKSALSTYLPEPTGTPPQPKPVPVSPEFKREVARYVKEFAKHQIQQFNPADLMQLAAVYAFYYQGRLIYIGKAQRIYYTRRNSDGTYGVCHRHEEHGRTIIALFRNAGHEHDLYAFFAALTVRVMYVYDDNRDEETSLVLAVENKLIKKYNPCLIGTAFSRKKCNGVPPMTWEDFVERVRPVLTEKPAHVYTNEFQFS